MHHTLVLQAPKVQGEQLCLHQLSGHDGQFLLHELEAGDGTIELDTRFGIVQGHFVTGPRCTGRSPGNAVTSFIQARKRPAQAADIG